MFLPFILILIFHGAWGSLIDHLQNLVAARPGRLRIPTWPTHTPSGLP